MNNRNMKINKLLALGLAALVNSCGTAENNRDIQQVDATDILDRADIPEDRRNCSNSVTVWPEWSETATLRSEDTDLLGNRFQELTVEIISPVTISSIYSDRRIDDGGYSAQLEINSVIQRTTLVYGTATGLHRLVPLEHNSCGYVYRLHVGFTNSGCGLVTCRLLNVGDRIRFRLNICTPVNGECLRGTQKELTITLAS